ncbi:MAG: hypothetical protein HGB22_11225 [Chlorobiaceae bacterium]|nr:hypothetical protein [Chlorobiaceae bacterium]
MQLRGEDKSDWKGAAALSSKGVDAAIADGGDEAGMQIDWSTASGELPRP